MKDLKLALKKEKNIAQYWKIGNCRIGRTMLMIAGPCAVEDEDDFVKMAINIKQSGAHILRGGIFKPRTSPYSFQGLGLNGAKILKRAKEETKLPVACEILDIRDLEAMYEFCDVFQIGARNMQNFVLLKELGKIDRPIILKRGISATLEEWLNSAEYIMQEGNEKLILCERGIRTYENYTRNTLDLAGVAAIKKISDLPVIVDPSHGTGRRELVIPLSLGAVMVGCDGLMVEVHMKPDTALSDSKQTIDFEMFNELSCKVKKTWTFRMSL